MEQEIRINRMLEKQYQELLAAVDRNGQDAARMREETQLEQMQIKIEELNDEIGKISLKNKEDTSKLTHLPFYK